MKLPIKKVFKIILLTIITSLSLTATAQTLQPIKEAEPQIKEFLKGTNYTHLNSLCRVYDLTGKSLGKELGMNCQFNPDGSYVVRSNISVREYTPKGELKWKLKLERTHHQIKKSDITGNSLTFHSDFKLWQKKNSRFDTLIVINPEGKVIKKFSLYDFFKNHPEQVKSKDPIQTYWYYKQIGIEKQIYEMTHANSFIELYKTIANGQKIPNGYLANCALQKKFFILDKELKTVVKVIDLKDRKTHSVQQISDNQVIFYQNSKDENSKISSAEMYDLQKNQFTTLYSANSPYLSSNSCGNVQPITETKLLVGHSSCQNPEKDFGFALEFVDLENQKVIKAVLDRIPHSNAYLTNAIEYLKVEKPF